MKTFFRRFPAWLLIICGASLLLMIGLALNMSPWLFGDMDWRWAYNPPAPLPVQVIWTGVILAGYIVLAGMLWRGQTP